MKLEFTGLRKEREAILPSPGVEEMRTDALEERVNDLELCLKGNPASKRWQELNVELTNKKRELLFARRRLAGRTMQMESWADPLPVGR